MTKAHVVKGGPKRTKEKARREKLSLYPLSIEDALRAAAETGRSPPLESQKPNPPRKKRTKPI